MSGADLSVVPLASGSERGQDGGQNRGDYVSEVGEDLSDVVFTSMVVDEPDHHFDRKAPPRAAYRGLVL